MRTPPTVLRYTLTRTQTIYIYIYICVCGLFYHKLYYYCVVYLKVHIFNQTFRFIFGEMNGNDIYIYIYIYMYKINLNRKSEIFYKCFTISDHQEA